jgi:hypothetical protein
MMRVEIPESTDSRFTLRMSSLVLVPLIDTDAWVRSQLGHGGFAISKLDTRTTNCGWPVLLAFGAHEGADMLRVWFRFQDIGAFAEAAGDLEAAWEVLCQARPDYDGELASISQLFS